MNWQVVANDTQMLICYTINVNTWTFLWEGPFFIQKIIKGACNNEVLSVLWSGVT